MSNVTEWHVPIASSPTQRWKQVPVRRPSSRCISCLATSSAGFTGHVQKPVDLPITDVRMHRSEVWPLGGNTECFCHRIDRRPDYGMIDRFHDTFAHEVNVHATAAQRIDVVFCGLDGSGEVRPKHLDVLHHTASGKIAPTL